MSLPENIVKMLSSGNPDDIELGLYLSLDFAHNEGEYHSKILGVYWKIYDYNREYADRLNMHCGWVKYYRKNK